MATTGSSIRVTGPFALYWRTTISVAAGAVAVVCQRLPEHLAPSVCYVVVADTNAAMADMAAAFYGDPSRQLKLVGITGTNGKTTTVTLLYDLFRGLGYKVGLISTVVYRIDTERIELSLIHISEPTRH